MRFAWAPEDRFFSLSDAERLAAIVPDGRVERVGDARTFVPLDQPARVAELIAGFVAEGRVADVSSALSRVSSRPLAGPTVASRARPSRRGDPQYARHLLADPSLGERDLDLDRPRVARGTRGGPSEASISYIVSLRGQQPGGEPLDPLGTGTIGEQAADRGPGPPAVPVVDDRHRGLGADAVVEPHESTDPDGSRLPRLALEGDQRLVVVVVDLGQVAKLRLARAP